MTEIILFGGTSEGRTLAEKLQEKGVATLACVATEYGEALLNPGPALRVHTGRLDRAGMEKLLAAEKPRLVIDATHPYAALVSENIQAACGKMGKRYLRLLRESLPAAGCRIFPGLEQLTAWVSQQPGRVFSTLGAKECAALTAIREYQERVWLRILPDVAGLSACLALGFPPQHIICMQGPFSQALNAAMFQAAGAKILLTKETGQAGGYLEKLSAAKACGMGIAVLTRPLEEKGLNLTAMLKQIEEDAL